MESRRSAKPAWGRVFSLPSDGQESRWAAGSRGPCADGSLAATDGLRDGLLVVSGLCHVGDHLTVVTAEAGVCVIHSQFVVKPD